MRLLIMGLTACAFMINPLYAAPRGRAVHDGRATSAFARHR